LSVRSQYWRKRRSVRLSGRDSELLTVVRKVKNRPNLSLWVIQPADLPSFFASLFLGPAAAGKQCRKRPVALGGGLRSVSFRTWPKTSPRTSPKGPFSFLRGFRVSDGFQEFVALPRQPKD
jgi:hypothetical protein